MTEQITVPRETWDAMREALESSAACIQFMTDGPRRADWGNTLDVIDAALTAANAVAHPQATDPQEAIAWEATTPGYIKYVTDRQYRSYSETAKRWYKPYKCSSCHPQSTEPAGYKLVPVIPTEEQWGGLARDIMMWMDLDGRKTAGSLFKHLERCGTSIPQWLRDEPEMKNLDHVPSKGTRVTIIYRAMLAAAPEAKQ